MLGGHIVLTMVGSEVLILGLLTCDVPAPLLQVNKKLEEVLTSKNSIIRALQYDVAKASVPAEATTSRARAPPVNLNPPCRLHCAWLASAC